MRRRQAGTGRRRSLQPGRMNGSKICEEGVLCNMLRVFTLYCCAEGKIPATAIRLQYFKATCRDFCHEPDFRLLQIFTASFSHFLANKLCAERIFNDLCLLLKDTRVVLCTICVICECCLIVKCTLCTTGQLCFFCCLCTLNLK